MADSHVDHLMKTISLANKAIQEARVAMDTVSQVDLGFKLALVGELLLKAHTEALAAVNSLGPQ